MRNYFVKIVAVVLPVAVAMGVHAATVYDRVVIHTPGGEYAVGLTDSLRIAFDADTMRITDGAAAAAWAVSEVRGWHYAPAESIEDVDSIDSYPAHPQEATTGIDNARAYTGSRPELTYSGGTLSVRGIDAPTLLTLTNLRGEILISRILPPGASTVSLYHLPSRAVYIVNIGKFSLKLCVN